MMSGRAADNSELSNILRVRDYGTKQCSVFVSSRTPKAATMNRNFENQQKGVQHKMPSTVFEKEPHLKDNAEKHNSEKDSDPNRPP
jgi:hypothetical protein